MDNLFDTPKEIQELKKYFDIEISDSNYKYDEKGNLVALDLIGDFPLKTISDISILSSYTSLERLALYDCDINDISALGNLINLRELHLITNNFKNISALALLMNLEILDLSRCKIENIEPLSNLSKLHTLNIANNLISDISPLRNLTNLLNLDISSETYPEFDVNEHGEEEMVGYVNGKIEDIESLSNLQFLEKLNLSVNRIKNITPLTNLTNLKLLDISDNDLENIEGISNMQHLTYLDLSSNKIENIEPLHSLNNLNELNLSRNNIKDITAIVNLKALTILNLEYNKIEKISKEIYHLDNLLDLNLVDNPIKDLPIEFCKLKKLRQLNINYDRLSDDSLFKHHSLAEIRKMYEIDGNASVSVIQIPELLQTSFQKYLTFFDEFVKRKTNNEKEISFSTKKLKDAIEMTVVLENNITPQEVDDFLKEYVDYINPQKITETQEKLRILEKENPILKLEIDMLKRQFEIDMITKQQILQIENKYEEREKRDHEFKMKTLDVFDKFAESNIGKNVVVNVDNNTKQHAQLSASIEFKNEYKENDELNKLKTKLEDIRNTQDYQTKISEEGMRIIAEGIDAIINLQNAKNSSELTQSKSKARSIFNQLKDIKDAVAISFLSVDIAQKLPKLIEQLS